MSLSNFFSRKKLKSFLIHFAKIPTIKSTKIRAPHDTRRKQIGARQTKQTAFTSNEKKKTLSDVHL